MLPAGRPTILLVDDDVALLSVLARRLEREGYRVHRVTSGHGALAMLETEWPDLLIVDLMMPRMDGFELCRRVKGLADLPIIVLSAVDASEAKVNALERYAEDYVTKPFEPDELVARVRRVLRRAPVGQSQLRFHDGAITVDLASRRVETPTGTHQLTRTEARLLQVLAGSMDQVVPTASLLDRVWSEAEAPEPSYAWVTVRRLRRKLELDPDHPQHLLTERGIGYRLTAGSRP